MQEISNEFLQFFEKNKHLLKSNVKLNKNQLYLLDNFKPAIIELYNKNYSPKEILKAINRFIRTTQNKKRIGLSIKDMNKVINLLKKEGVLNAKPKSRPTVKPHVEQSMKQEQPKPQSQPVTPKRKPIDDDDDEKLSHF